MVDKVIEITAAYSNAVLVAVLPYVSDFARRIELPIPLPVTSNAVAHAHFYRNPGDVQLSIALGTGHMFHFRRGHVADFGWPDSAIAWREPGKDYTADGTNVLTEAQAIGLLRATFRKLGIDEELLYADLEPTVSPVPHVTRAMVPHYQIEWPAVNRDGPSVTCYVDAYNKRVTRLIFLNYALWRSPPRLSVEPLIRQVKMNDDPEPVDLSPEEGWQHCARVLPAFDRMLAAFGVPVAVPLATNEVSAVRAVRGSPGDPGAIALAITLSNRYELSYGGGQPQGFDAPDRFFGWGHEVRLRDYFGRHNLTESQLLALARAKVTQLGSSLKELGMTEPPEVRRPYGKGVAAKVPRYEFRWQKVNEQAFLVSSVILEMDATDGSVKSFDLFLADH